MTTAYAIQTILEILAVLFVVYGILNEKKFVAFENKVCRIIKRKVYIYRKRKAIEAAKAKKVVTPEIRNAKRSYTENRRVYQTQFVA